MLPRAPSYPGLLHHKFQENLYNLYIFCLHLPWLRPTPRKLYTSGWDRNLDSLRPFLTGQRLITMKKEPITRSHSDRKGSLRWERALGQLTVNTLGPTSRLQCKVGADCLPGIVCYHIVMVTLRWLRRCTLRMPLFAQTRYRFRPPIPNQPKITRSSLTQETHKIALPWYSREIFRQWI